MNAPKNFPRNYLIVIQLIQPQIAYRIVTGQWFLLFHSTKIRKNIWKDVLLLLLLLHLGNKSFTSTY